MILCFKFKKGEMIVYCIWEEDNVGYYSELALDDTFREDYSYQSPELQLQWRIEDLTVRLEDVSGGNIGTAASSIVNFVSQKMTLLTLHQSSFRDHQISLLLLNLRRKRWQH